MLDPFGENFPLKFRPQCSLIRSVQFYPRGLNLDPGSTNSSRIAPQVNGKGKVIEYINKNQNIVQAID
jgi:hypothetical protein